MSTRVITDRELLHNLRFEVGELARGLAAAVERLEAVETSAGVDERTHSVRVGPSAVLAFSIRSCERCRHAAHRHYMDGCNDCSCDGLLLDATPARGFVSVTA